jgi:HSP20 family protein
MVRYAYDPFQEFEMLRRELSRLVEGLPVTSRLFRSAFVPAVGGRSFPLLNVAETPEAITVEALMPGVDPASLQVQVVQRQLTISGDKPAAADVKPEEYHRNERGAARFSRSLTLPVDIDNEAVKAEYRHGILTITLPKAAAARPRQIAVSMN